MAEAVRTAHVFDVRQQVGVLLSADELARDAVPSAARATGLERQLAELFEAVVGRTIGPDQSFFDAGATSLALMRFHLRCRAAIPAPLAMADLFEHVTIRRLARTKDFLRAREGTTAIEYGLITALIALAAIISMQLLGINLADTFSRLASVIGGAIGSFCSACSSTSSSVRT